MLRLGSAVCDGCRQSRGRPRCSGPGCRGPQDPVLKGDDGEQPPHEVQGGQTAGGPGTTLPSFLTRASVFIRWPLAAPA